MIHRAVLALLVTVVAASCAEETDKAMTACNLACDVKGTATQCLDLTAFVAACHADCARVIPKLDQSCKDVAEQAYGCEAVLTYRCQSNQTEPTPTTTACTTSRAELDVCLAGVGE